MQDPSISRISIPQMPPTPLSGSSSYGNSAILPRGSHHRRAHSAVNFQLPDNLDPVSSDPFYAPACMGSEDDLFSAYINMDEYSGGQVNFEDGLRIENEEDAMRQEGKNGRGLRHRHSNSVDGSSMVECIEAKKAMAPDKLAELWTLDPKRAKRIMANRQSAARSKERKARYISQLETKVQTLQTEATALSAQLTLFQRDTMELTTENSKLKIRLQTLEQQAHLQDALNESLKKEVERLQKATGETSSFPSDNYSLGMHHILYKHLCSPPQQHHAAPNDPQNIHISQFHQLKSSMTHDFTATVAQQDSLSRLPGLDINGRGPVIVKTEGLSLPTS